MQGNVHYEAASWPPLITVGICQGYRHENKLDLHWIALYELYCAMCFGLHLISSDPNHQPDGLAARVPYPGNSRRSIAVWLGKTTLNDSTGATGAPLPLLVYTLWQGSKLLQTTSNKQAPPKRHRKSLILLRSLHLIWSPPQVHLDSVHIH